MKRINKSAELFNSGYNCSQSVVCAYCDLFGISAEDGRKLASGFGAGIAGMRGICGAVSGMVILAGMKHGDYHPDDKERKTKLYSLIRFMNDKFVQKFSTTNCKELLARSSIAAEINPKERNEHYYKTRPCAKFVEHASSIVEEVLLNG